MADYKAAEVVGSSWQRTNQIVITNPHNGIPTVIYNEEKIVSLGGGEIITTPCGNFSVSCNDMTEIITLLNPMTGEATEETMTIGKLYQAIYSHYITKALERDNASAQPPEE